MLEARFPWRGFWQDWGTAIVVVAIYLVLSSLFSGVAPTLLQLRVIVPQLLLSIVLFPIIVRMVALLDRLRLMRIRRLP